MLVDLFSLFFLFVPCGGLSWLHVSYCFTLNTQYRRSSVSPLCWHHDTTSAVDSSSYPRRPRLSVGCSACMEQSATKDSGLLLTFDIPGRGGTKSHLFRQSYGWRGAVYSEGQRTSALSCATVLNLDFCKVPPQLCEGSTLIHDICSSVSWHLQS